MGACARSSEADTLVGKHAVQQGQKSKEKTRDTPLLGVKNVDRMSADR